MSLSQYGHLCRKIGLNRSRLVTSQSSPRRINKRYAGTIKVASACQVPYADFQLTLLGTSSGVPTKKRGVSSYGIRFGTEHFLVDCGEGAQTKIRESPIMNISRIRRIFITHLHGDHTWGLFGVIASTLIGNNTPEHLDIYGPPGLPDLVYRALKRTATSYPARLLHVHELGVSPEFPLDPETGSFTCFEDSSMIIRAAPITHSVPCFGYVFEEKTKRGHLKVEALQALGLQPGPLYKEIQNQWLSPTIKLSTGLSLDREAVIEPPTIGRKLVVLGDTCDPRRISDIAQDACALVHECTLPSGWEALAKERAHSTGTMAARFASSIGARTLVLSHFSPRFTDELLATELTKVKEHFTGQIFTGADHDVLNLSKRTFSSNPEEKDPLATLYQFPLDAEENLNDKNQPDDVGM